MTKFFHFPYICYIRQINVYRLILVCILIIYFTKYQNKKHLSFNNTIKIDDNYYFGTNKTAWIVHFEKRLTRKLILNDNYNDKQLYSHLSTLVTAWFSIKSKHSTKKYHKWIENFIGR